MHSPNVKTCLMRCVFKKRFEFAVESRIAGSSFKVVRDDEVEMFIYHPSRNRDISSDVSSRRRELSPDRLIRDVVLRAKDRSRSFSPIRAFCRIIPCPKNSRFGSSFGEFEFEGCAITKV